MKTIVRCPQCHRSYQVAEESLGRSAKCRHCGRQFTLEAAPAGTPGSAGATQQNSAGSPSSPEISHHEPVVTVTVCCPACKRRLQVAQKHLGRLAKCRHCSRQFTLNAAPAESATVVVEAELVPDNHVAQPRTPAGAGDSAFGARPCPSCNQFIPSGGVLCVACGYDFRLGQRWTTSIVEESIISDRPARRHASRSISEIPADIDLSTDDEQVARGEGCATKASSILALAVGLVIWISIGGLPGLFVGAFVSMLLGPFFYIFTRLVLPDTRPTRRRSGRSDSTKAKLSRLARVRLAEKAEEARKRAAERQRKVMLYSFLAIPVLIALVVIVALLAPETEYGKIRKAFPDSVLKQYVEIEGLKEEIAEVPYVTGKILVIERQDESQSPDVYQTAVYSPRISSLMTELPPTRRAAHPAEVACVVWVFQRYEKPRPFDDGYLRSETVSTLKIVDVESGTVIGKGGPFVASSPLFQGEEPVYPNPPREAVVRFLSALPTKPLEQTTATVKPQEPSDQPIER